MGELSEHLFSGRIAAQSFMTQAHLDLIVDCDSAVVVEESLNVETLLLAGVVSHVFTGNLVESQTIDNLSLHRGSEVSDASAVKD